MCKPSRKLHSDEKVTSEVKINVKVKVTKKQAKQVSKPNEAEYFFLMNEDVLH